MMEIMARFQQPVQPYQNAWVMYEPVFLVPILKLRVNNHTTQI